MGSKPGAPFTVRLDEDGESRIIRATGELDLATTEALQKALQHAFDGDTASLILDVSEVTFIDSTGLRALLWAAHHDEGDRLRVRCGAGAVRRMVEMTGIERSLRLIA